MSIKNLSIIFIFLAFFFSGVTFSFAAAEVIVLKAATVQPRKHRLHDDAYLHWGKEIEKRTNGRVKFKWYLAGSLVKHHQSEKAVQSGLVDVVVQSAVWLNESQYPVTTILHLPLMVDSPLHGAYAYYKAYQEIPEVRKEHDKVVPLAFFTTGSTDIMNKKKLVRKIEDLNGMKIWCGAKSSIDMFKLLGATPVQVKLEDVYMSLQRGMFDGVFFPLAPARSFKLVELANKHTIGSFALGCQYYAMNKKKWNSLPDDIKKVFQDMTLSTGILSGAVLTNEAAWVLDELETRGDEIYRMTPADKAEWRKALQPMYKDKVEALNKQGLDGEALLKKMISIAEETRQNPYKPDDWWGRAGKKQ